MLKRGFLYTGIALYVASFMLSLPYPNNMNTYASVQVLTVPIKTTDGLYMEGILSILLLIASIVCFMKSVTQLKSATIIIPIVVYLVLPSVAIPMYQAYFAKGMYALSYEQEKAACQLTALDEQQLQLYCELPMQNYSNEPVNVALEFIGHDDVTQQLNAQAPYAIEVPAKLDGLIVVDELLINETQQVPYVQSTTNFAIRFVENDKKRTM
ncbi:MAG: hypothetical protein UHX00_03855 [Caryophanon sp.]|nr:hypothetical protein [Caryophanon sp.]